MRRVARYARWHGGSSSVELFTSFAAVVTRAMTTDRAIIEEKAKNAVFPEI
jgi:hypothetical protein